MQEQRLQRFIAILEELLQIAKTEFWNGTSWTEVGDLGTARSSGGSGQARCSSAVYCVSGGYTTTVLLATEEFTKNRF